MVSEHRELAAQWGYAFSRNGCSNGGSTEHPMQELWFVLREEPTGQHYDPLSARLWLILGNNGLERRLLRHPWRGSETVTAGPGHVQLRDRFGRTVDAYTFGGQLKITPCADNTCCTLQSPAPIFDLRYSEQYSAAKILCERVEVLLARRKASWISEPAGFSRKLAETSPLDLYLSCLKELLETGSPPAMSTSSEENKYVMLLHSEVSQLASNGLWSEKVPEIAALV
ncbi:MAG: hypothetical protein JXA25_20365 [Anaerolineales bacterium]|nr:hypothetical protein [Anaerolineales bacterium]